MAAERITEKPIATEIEENFTFLGTQTSSGQSDPNVVRVPYKLGIGLPEVGSADNGTLLGVKNSKWDKVDPDDVKVGLADNLSTRISGKDRTPYSYRTAGGALEIGNSVKETAIVGCSYAWNQLIGSSTMGENKTEAGVSFAKNNKGKLVITGEKTTAANTYFQLTPSTLPTGRKYLIGGADTANANVGGASGGYNVFCRYTGGGTSFAKQYGAAAKVIAPSAESAATFGLEIQVGYSGAGIVFNEEIYPYCIDLTVLFGVEIADYIYALDQAQAGAGEAFFRRYFPSKYYNYDAGTLMHVEPDKKIVVGFNAWDGNIAYVVGGHAYAIEGTYTSFVYKNDRNQTVAVTLDEDGYYTFPEPGSLEFTGAGEDLCVHLAWDGERDGDYEEYREREYAFDDLLRLCGLPRLDADGELYHDGDVYEPDGTVTRKYGVVDLGSLSWSYEASLTRFYATAPSDADASGYTVFHPVAAAGYVNSTVPIGAHDQDRHICTILNRIYLTNFAYTDKNALKAALSGVYMVYKKATPTTESAEPYTEEQRLDNWGTEYLADRVYDAGNRDVAIPYGHVSAYLLDLKAKLEVAPEAPETDGRYRMRRENGINKYERDESDLPSLPTADGTYRLTVTVLDGVATLSWVSAT